MYYHRLVKSPLKGNPFLSAHGKIAGADGRAKEPGGLKRSVNSEKEVLILRPANQADASGIAAVHVASWLSTYRGILADQLLDQLSVSERTENWARWLEPPPPDSTQAPNWVWVAESPSGQIVGFVCGGPERTGLPDFAGEIYALYLLDAWHGQGWGKRLLHKGFDLLRAQGHATILVWVASGNQKASDFYASQGGQICLQRSLEMAGQTVDETGYGWV